MRRRSSRFTVLELLENRSLLSANILVNTGELISEYKPDGTLVRSTPVQHAGASTDYARDLAVDDQGHLFTYDGSATVSLGVYDRTGGTWSYATTDGWNAFPSSPAPAYVGHLAAAGKYVFATDGPTAGVPAASDVNRGVIRFDRGNNYAATRFATTLNPTPDGVTVGLDGLVYTTNRVAGAAGVHVSAYDPETLALDHEVTILTSGDASPAAIAVDAQGTIFLARASTTAATAVQRYTYDRATNTATLDGSFADSAFGNLAGVAAGHADIEVAPDGTLIFSSLRTGTDPTYRVIVTNEAFSAATSFSLSGTVSTAFLSFDVPPAAPPPANNAPVLNAVSYNPASTQGKPDGTYNEGTIVGVAGNFSDADAGDAHVVTFDWGDGTAATVFNLPAGVTGFSTGNFPHRYFDHTATGARQGTFTLTLTVSDGTDAAVTTRTVNVLNVAPVVIANPSYSAAVNQAFTLTPSNRDPGVNNTTKATLQTDTLSYAWVVTDGAGAVAATGTARTVTFTPAAYGNYTLSYTVTDDDGASGSATATIVVANTAPVVSVGADLTLTEVQAANVTAAASDSPGDTLAYAWTITDAGGGTVASGNSTAISFAPGDNGNFTVTFTATDQAGLSTTDTAVLTFTDLAPTATMGAGPTFLNEGSGIVITGSATDPSAIDTAAGLALNWTVTRGGVFFASASGPSFAFNPGDEGAYFVTLTAADKDGGVSSAASRTINVANVPPTLTLTAPATAVEGASYTIGLGSSDPGADTISSWRIDWGDGTVDTLPGNPSSATHVYTDGPADFAITARATDEDGVWSAPSGLAPVLASTVAAPTGDGLAAGPGGTFFTVGFTSGSTWAVNKYRADGSLDPAFGVGGSAVAPAVTYATLKSVQPRADGGAYAVGDWWDGGATRLLAASYSATGQLERFSTFNDTLPGNDGTAALAPDGRLMVLTGSAVYRLNADLTIDPTYGSGGAATIAGPTGYGAITVMADGRVVVASTVAGGNYNAQIVVARFNPDGTPDTSFFFTGRENLFTQGQYQEAWGVAAAPDGRVLVVARSQPAFDTPADYSAILLKADGAVDTRFGSNGLLFVDDNSSDFAPGRAATFLPDGGFLLAYGTNIAGQVIVRRFRADASPDTSFGTGGVLGSLIASARSVTRPTAAIADSTGGVRLLVDVPSGYDNYLLTFTPGRPTVHVENAAPTATVTATSADEGSFASVIFTNPSDPSAADAAAGFTYGYDFDNDGVFDLVTTNSAGADRFDRSGEQVVRVRITDKDGGYTDYFPTVTINNVAPAVSLGDSATTGVEGQAVTVAASATDPSAADTAAGFGFAWAVTKDGAAYASGSGPAVSFTPDDDGTYVLSVTATDVDGGTSSPAGRTFTVGNAAPVAAIAASATAVTETQTVTLTASATDVSGADTAAGFAYAWAVTKNGSPFAAGTGAAFTLTPDDNGTYVVTLTATDKDGGASAGVSRTVVASNVAPAAVFANSGPVVEGSTGATVSFAGQSDGAADLAAGLTYAYDFDGNGTWDLTTTSAVAALPASVTADGPATKTVRGRVTDKDGASTTYTTAVTVTNAPPQVTISGPTGAKRNAKAKFTIGVADPSATDQASGFTYAVDWDGDGRVDQTVKGGSSVTLSEQYKKAGTYAISVWVTDKDGGTTMVKWVLKVS